jgi:hypothetical protein
MSMIMVRFEKEKLNRQGAKAPRLRILASWRLGVAKFLLLLPILAVALPLLAACGKRASPEPPPGEKSTYPRTYPNPNEQP